MFTEFQLEQPTLENLPVFMKGAAFFCDDLTKPFLSEIDNDIDRVQEQLDLMKRTKEAKVKEMIDMLDLIESTKKATKAKEIELLNMFDFMQTGNLKDPLEEAIKTLRKLPLFGKADYDASFEWPKPTDLLSMPKGKAIQTTGFKLKSDYGKN